MAIITGTDNNQYTTIKDQYKYKREEGSIDNPGGALDSEAFLKLFIESLKNQSIDSTTDIKEIMQYTASMTTVQTNNANKEALENVVNTLQKNSDYQSQFGLLPSIGKLAVTKLNSLKFDGAIPSKFTMYSNEAMNNGTLHIKDSTGSTIKSIPLNEYVNSSGVVAKDDQGNDLDKAQGLISLSWDGVLQNGLKAQKNSYQAQIDYKNDKGLDKSINLGEYRVQSVKFKDNEAYLNVGNLDVKLGDILELRELQ